MWPGQIARAHVSARSHRIADLVQRVAHPRGVGRAIFHQPATHPPGIMPPPHLLPPAQRYDPLYISNYAFLQVRDELSRIPGISDVLVWGAGEYSMRLWLDPNLIAARGLTAGDVIAAVREQNVQVAAGSVGQASIVPERCYALGFRLL